MNEHSLKAKRQITSARFFRRRLERGTKRTRQREGILSGITGEEHFSRREEEWTTRTSVEKKSEAALCSVSDSCSQIAYVAERADEFQLCY
jgi:hypothetical protein